MMAHFSLRKFIPVLLAFLALTSCRKAPEWRYTGGAAWGTVFNITYLSDTDLSDSVTAVMRQVELALSTFDKQSNISAINSGATDTLAPMTYHVFREAKRVNAISHGAFDPTVAPLVNLWGFGYRTSLDESPDSDRIAAVLERVGMDACSVDSVTRVVTRKHRHTEFDFSAIAKGYGVDCVADMLRRNGCTDFMVEIGGEMAVAGQNPRGTEWRVQIDSPLSDSVSHAPLRVLPLSDCAVATSGNYRNYRRLPDGSIVSHTISPVTGRPVRSNVLSVTVFAPQCITADALATAAMVLPLPQARALLASQPGGRALIAVAPVPGTDSLTVIAVP